MIQVLRAFAALAMLVVRNIRVLKTFFLAEVVEDLGFHHSGGVGATVEKGDKRPQELNFWVCLGSYPLLS